MGSFEFCTVVSGRFAPLFLDSPIHFSLQPNILFKKKLEVSHPVSPGMEKRALLKGEKIQSHALVYEFFTNLTKICETAAGGLFWVTKL